MKIGEKFSSLSATISENTSYKLNTGGAEMVKRYHELIAKLESVAVPLLEPYTKNPTSIAKQAAIQIVSTINSTKEGNRVFDLMARLDTLTNGGKTIIPGNTFVFNQNDEILLYLENA